jgi:hypothetical protein
MAGHSWYATERAQALRGLDDDGLLSRLSSMAGQEREGLADLVEHLMELDRRGTAVDRGYSSLFDYCAKGLGYSDQAAYLRIRAVRVARDLPEVLGHLREGRLHLETIARLSKHLNKENVETLLPRALGATKREVLALVAELEPAPVERDAVIPVSREVVSPKTEEDARSAPGAAERSPVQPDIVPPLRHRVHFTADGGLIRLLDRLRALLRHKHPSGRLEDLVKEAAECLLDKIDPDRAKPSRPLKAERKRSRLVPRAVKREVWRRDLGRCAYISDDGRRCESRDALEYDHVLPWALGGVSDDAANIRLLCRPHNQRLAQRRFGPKGANYGRP